LRAARSSSLVTIGGAGKVSDYLAAYVTDVEELVDSLTHPGAAAFFLGGDVVERSGDSPDRVEQAASSRHDRSIRKPAAILSCHP
jgi:hypothetical protein